MNEELLKLSLRQGQMFNTYKKGVSTNKKRYNVKEGFISQQQEQMVRPSFSGYVPALNNMQKRTTAINNVNQRELDELTQLQSKYNNLMQEYTNLQKSIDNSTLNEINRTSSNNPYLGKNIRFTNGTICYVTHQGIAKPYANQNDYINTANRNGCPSQEYVQLNMAWSTEYIKGATIPTNPSLIVGSNMTIGESCGNEGLNVYASTMVNNPTSTYIGCYNNISNPNNSVPNSSSTSTNGSQAMIYNSDNIGYTTFDNCKSYAIDNGYKYFGLQDYTSDGTAACLVSNDIATTKIYGEANALLTITPIWASNTQTSSGATSAKLGNSGVLFLLNDSGNTVWQNSDSGVASCEVQYSFTDNSDASGDDIFHSADMSLSQCQKTCTDNLQCFGISMNTVSNNECWLKSQFQTITSSNDRALYKKLVPSTNCSFILILQDDGNLCIYQGTPGNMIQPAVWCSMTYGKQLQPNSDWESTKSSLGRNYIINGEMIAVNQWIGSNNGSLKLIMQSDGNFVLYTSSATNGCVKNGDVYYGGPSVNSVYELNSVGNRNTLGKLGYVDADSNLKEYPTSMLNFTNDYQVYQNTDSMGNDITNLTTDQDGCQTACNNNVDCAAYVYQASSQTCWLKNTSAFPNGEKQINSTVTLGVRIPGVKGSTTCSNKVIDVDTIQYDNYLKGNNMTSSTQCNQPIISKSNQLAYENITSQLNALGKDIASKMENLYNKDNKIYQKLNTNEEQFAKDLKKYKLTKFKINNELIEGMQNLNDLNGMLSDSDLRILQENYRYIMWSILAVGILTITINAMKK